MFAARALANENVDVLLIDRNNYHTFTPLLYQVATCALDPSEIAYPVRTTVRHAKNINFLLGTVTNSDQTARVLRVDSPGQIRQESYDYLIIATGSTPTYFGNDAFRKHAFELRTLQDAVQLRNQVLKRFEQAAWADDPQEQAALTTIVVVGGGPTGIETAGAIHELYNYVLEQEFVQGSPLKARVILVEMLPHLLAPYPEKLRQSAVKQLRSLGVEVLLEKRVEEVGPDFVRLGDGQVIHTHTLVWTAGVKASPLAEMLGVGLQRGGRVPVKPSLNVIDTEHIYAVGDIAYLEDEQGQPYPMLIPVASQQGKLAAQNILADLQGQPQAIFHYHYRGTMATIGRRRAVAWIFNRIPLQGYIAWVAWLGLHLVTLITEKHRGTGRVFHTLRQFRFL
ncbi:MAG: NAD(P)/FAD-dependent oxidoreductase, partial [Chloroflexota bacterium]